MELLADIILHVFPGPMNLLKIKGFMTEKNFIETCLDSRGQHFLLKIAFSNSIILFRLRVPVLFANTLLASHDFILPCVRFWCRVELFCTCVSAIPIATRHKFYSNLCRACTRTCTVPIRIRSKVSCPVIAILKYNSIVSGPRTLGRSEKEICHVTRRSHAYGQIFRVTSAY